MRIWMILKKETAMTNTGSMVQRLPAIQILAFKMLIACSRNSFRTITSIMMKTVTFILAFLAKREDLDHSAPLLALPSSKMTFFQKALEVWIEEDFRQWNRHLSEGTVGSEGLQNLWAQQREQCNKYLIFRNGKTVTTKKVTIVNPDGSKEIT